MAGADRAIYMDESGDSETNLLVSAVSFNQGLDDDAAATIEELLENLSHAIPTFDPAGELHARKLVRELRPLEARERADEALLRTHEKDFIYQHVLHSAADLPSLQVNTVMWRWEGDAKPKGREKGYRHRVLLGRLLDWIAEDQTPVARAVIDAAGQAKHYETAYRDAALKHGGLFLSELEAVDSTENRLVQLADLAAHAAFQPSNPNRRPELDRMIHWYRDALIEVWAGGGDGHGCRHYEGDLADPMGKYDPAWATHKR